MGQQGFGSCGGMMSGVAGLLKDQLQQNFLSFDEEEFEPTSVLDLTSCISPPLQTDVWTEQALQANLQAEFAFQHHQAQYAWEQQQQLLLWEHQQQQLQLWEQQYRQHTSQLVTTRGISPCVSEQVSNFGSDQQQKMPQQPRMDPWLEVEQSLSDLSSELSSSTNLPSFEDEAFDFDVWLSDEGSSAAEESIGSFVVNDESSTAQVMTDEVSSNSYESGLSGIATDLQFAAGCEWSDDIEPPSMGGNLRGNCNMDEPISCLQFNVLSPTNSSVVTSEAAAIQLQVQELLRHHPTPKLRSQTSSSGLQTDTTSSPKKQQMFPTQDEFRPEAALQPRASTISLGFMPTTPYNHIQKRARLMSDSTVWQSNSSTLGGNNHVIERAAAAADGTYHGGMIMQLDITQSVGRMGVETSNTRARVGVDLSSPALGGEQQMPHNNLRAPMSALSDSSEDVGGVKMVQLLLACAEAVACRDSRQATSLLQQLQFMATPHGDSMQRVTSCFVEGLTARLAITGSQPQTVKSLLIPRQPPNEMQKQEGFNLFYQASPYVAFGHFAANAAILEAFEGEDAIHILDLGMTNELQWPNLIHGLATRPGGPPRLLRITGFGLDTEKMKEAGYKLTDFARLQKVNFEFRVVTESLENLQRSMLDLTAGEALAVNSLLQLHCVVKESRGSLNAVLQSIHGLNPKILTLVEQDASHNGPFFLGRFMEALHYYSAIFDSLDAILPRYSPQRVKMEQFHFAEEIKNIVSCEGPARVERHERVDQWRRRMSRAGFQPLSLKFLSQARSWLGLYSCDGYTLSEEKGSLVLGWKGKPLIAASSWRC